MSNDPGEEAQLLAYLHDRDVACPLCGYNLRGLTSCRCPECGRELKLTVGMIQPYLTAWVALAVTLCASGGLGLFCIAMEMKKGFSDWPFMYKSVFDITFMFHMVIVPVAIAALVFRRMLLRMSPAFQWAVVGFLAPVCVIMFTLFILYV